MSNAGTQEFIRVPETSARATPDITGMPLPPQTQPTISTEPISPQSGTDVRRRKLESIVENFRAGNFDRFFSISALMRDLASDTELSAEEKDSTFRLYYAKIDSIDTRTHARLATRGEPNLQESNASPDKGKDPERSETYSGGAVEFLERLSKRAVSNEPDSEDEGERTHKKVKLIESDMPWARGNKGMELGSNPSCNKTVKLLKLFNRDIKQAKFFVSVAPGVLGNIPPSQWERILKGESVDLNQVLSSIHRITTLDKKKAKIGETEISLGAVEAARKISSYNEWSIAWRKAARAISFVFPHRKEELDEYTDYIEGEFEAKQTTAHCRVIHFDIAVRNLVCGGQQILLTDTQKFLRLYSAIMQPDGIQNASESKRTSAGKKRDICN